jgi:predicted O-methyltransferase YrrM
LASAVDLDVFAEFERRYPVGILRDSSSVATSVCVYGLIRLIQPAVVVEMGTWEGATSIWMARALAENGRGEYIGYEVREDKAMETHAALSRAVPGGRWTVKNQSCLDERYIEVDFLFMDHAKEQYGPAFSKCLFPIGGYCVAHDTQAWPNAVKFYQHLKLLPEWEILNIQQERGLMIARKVA